MPGREIQGIQVNEVFRYKRWIFNHDVRSNFIDIKGPGTGLSCGFTCYLTQQVILIL